MTWTIPKTMRAAVYRGVNDLRLETVPVPRIGPHELLVRVAACGICPTDLKKIRYGTVPPPRIFGHETAGTVVKVGARVHGFRVGDRVSLHHHVPCLNCHYCRHRAFAQCPQYKRTGVTAGFEPAGGGFSEYVRVMRFALPGVVRIPPANSFEEGAMLEPVNTVLKAVRRLTVLRGDCVLVMGQGPVGLMFTRLLALEGVRVVATDLLPARLRMARKFGARLALHPAQQDVAGAVARCTRGRGLDAAVVAVPSEEAVQAAFDLVRGGGQVLLFAHTRRKDRFSLDLSRICVDEQDLIGSYSSDITLQNEVARLVFGRSMDVRPLVTHRLPLAQVVRAVGFAERPTEKSLKIMVCPGLV